MIKSVVRFDKEYTSDQSDLSLYYNGFNVSQEFDSLGIDVSVQISNMMNIASIFIFENEEDMNLYRLSGKIKEEKDLIAFMSLGQRNGIENVR